MIDNKAFHKISYGLYIVSSKLGDRLNGQIVNTIFQVTSEPPMVAVSINKQNLTHSYIHETGFFSISVLSTGTPMELIGKFGFKSGRDIDKFKDISYTIGETGVPKITDNTVACFEIGVEKEIDVFTHTIFLGRVIQSEVLNDQDQMTYDYYQKVKHGISPKTAPTYINTKQENKNIEKEVNTMSKYKCNICGYEYDPEVGDPEADIPAGTSFEDLPDDWVCPICGASKEDFELED